MRQNLDLPLGKPVANIKYNAVAKRPTVGRLVLGLTGRVFRKKNLCQNQSHRVAKDDKYCLKEHVKILTLYPNGK